MHRPHVVGGEVEPVAAPLPEDVFGGRVRGAAVAPAVSEVGDQAGVEVRVAWVWAARLVDDVEDCGDGDFVEDIVGGEDSGEEDEVGEVSAGNEVDVAPTRRGWVGQFFNVE